MSLLANGIWSSVEVDAWSRGFDYTGYVDLHIRAQCAGKMLSVPAYQALCKLFEDEVARDEVNIPMPVEYTDDGF